jgi:diguanylate cyclase (GGDEF)-like protein
MKTERAVLLASVVATASVFAGRFVQRKLDAAAQERETLRLATEQLRHRNEQLNALYNIFSEITETLSLRYVVDATLRETLRLMDAQGSVLWLIKEGKLIPAGGLTSAGRGIKGLEPQVLGEGLMGRTAKRGRTLRIDDQNQNMLSEAQRAQGLRSGIMVPLIVGARVVGLLNCWSITSNAFNDEDQRILEMMASQVATAVVAADSMDTTERQAHHDALTDLPNRLQLNQDLAENLKGIVESGRQAVVAMLDVDHFKALNDEFGHRVGDITLQKIAAVLRNSVRERDLLYRYGGEEFVLVFPDAGAGEAVDLAERLRKAVESTPFSGDQLRPVGPVTVSIGLAVLGSHALDFPALIDAADKAMYEAKQAGRNRVVLWHETIEHASEILALTTLETHSLPRAG